MEVLDVLPVETLWQALRMRKLRNQCRQFMTQDTSKISLIRQIRWFYNVYLVKKNNGEMIAYLGYMKKKPVAYGIIRDLKTRPTASIGVAKKYRGHGIGKTLFRFLTDEASRGDMSRRIGDKTVFLEVREENKKALHMYCSLGYVEKARNNGIIFMQKDYGEFD